MPTSLGAADPLRRSATRRRRYVGLFDPKRFPAASAEAEAEAPPIVPEVEQQQPPATKRDRVVVALFGRDASQRDTTTDTAPNPSAMDLGMNPTTEQEI